MSQYNNVIQRKHRFDHKNTGRTVPRSAKEAALLERLAGLRALLGRLGADLNRERKLLDMEKQYLYNQQSAVYPATVSFISFRASAV